MSARATLGAALAGALLLFGCASQRPTEFLIVTFTPSVATEHYATWDFELESCVDVDDPRFDAPFLRGALLRAIEDELALRGFAHVPGGEDADFTVFYEFELAGDGDGAEERARGRILVRDVATGRLVWRGERKAPLATEAVRADRLDAVRRFARELLAYTAELEADA